MSLDVEVRSGAPALHHADAGGDATGWASAHRDALRATLAEHGAVMVRGLGLGDVAAVAAVAADLSDQLVVEREAFASRESYPGGVYSSSAWSPKQPMCMHHELSYTLEPPSVMMFACLTPPDEGGVTGVADSPTVLGALPPELVARFEAEGWSLVRSYTEDIGLGYAEAFGMDDRGEIEAYCQANGIEFAWHDDDELRTRQHRPAVVTHPVTGQRCWFNQIAFLNEFTMNPDVREFLIDMYGEDGLPFNTRYGNGDGLADDVVEVVNDVYDAHTLREPWQAGDLLVVDNIRMAHSREPYSGDREIVVAMADPVRLS